MTWKKEGWTTVSMFFSVLCSLLSNDKRLGDSPASPSNVHPDRRRKGGLAQNHAQALLSEHFQIGLSVHSIYYTVFTWGSGGFVYGHLGAYACTISGGTRRFRKPPGGVNLGLSIYRLDTFTQNTEATHKTHGLLLKSWAPLGHRF